MNVHPYLQDQDFYPCPTPTGASDLCFQLNLGAYQLFLANLRPDPNSSTTFSCQSVDGGTNLPNASLASAENDDTQYTVGLASGVPTTCVSVGPNSAHYITYLAAMDQLPRVLAASYGVKDFVLSRVNLCNGYAQSGARLASILLGSGDGGVAGLSNTPCTNFVPTFPSSSPCVTSVGASTGTNLEAATT
ncbi:hypothetical protein JAAARDRAFT_199764 [Jaapia argillacea MUCL 33604]|uniref:Peptidase S53 domain-containing protein n=1 Tax=Jaapia argillacea MUCL 33604 TaxID=933084 RepID=A0A067P777_9AGAM|nr:hypothetical protein JAAARDRAFT_199764 [Jaapia argillacea MUCL 33604]